MSKEDFSLCRRIAMDIDPRYRKDAEREFRLTSEAADDRSASLPAQRGFVVPTQILTGRRDLTVATEGTDLVDDETQPSILDVKNNQPAVVRAGAKIWPNLTADVSIPRATADPSAAWYSEQGTNAGSDPTFDSVTLTPKRVAGRVSISRRLLIQARPDIEAWLRNALLRQITLAVDLAAINGSGTNNQPEGILNTSGIGAYSATSGADAVTWEMLVGLWKEVASDNTDPESLTWLASPAVVAEMASARKDTGSGRFIVENLSDGVLGSRIVQSNQVPTDLQSDGDKAALIVGDFRDLYIGLFGEPVVIVDPYSNAATGTVNLTIEQFVDIAVAYPSSFAATQDIALSV